MRTVKEVAALTGVSVRTLHYYDEIGLLKPTDKSEAGYRLYDESALETLQQILFFREFEIPLKEIKEIMDHPDLDRSQILQMQKRMLQAKQLRMERLISNIDDILKGGNKMDFTLFDRTEMKELTNLMWDHMPDSIRQTLINEYGTKDKWMKQRMDHLSEKEVQHGIQIMGKWDEEENKHGSKEIERAFQKRIDSIVEKLLGRKDQPLDSFSIKEVIGEYGFVMKRIYETDQEEKMMLNLAADYREDITRREVDQRYGDGSADFIADAIEVFYKH